MELVENPRIGENACRVTEICGDTEWICIRTVHAKLYRRKSSSGPHKKGDIRYDYRPSAEQHYFVNRWPNRNRES